MKDFQLGFPPAFLALFPPDKRKSIYTQPRNDAPLAGRTKDDDEKLTQALVYTAAPVHKEPAYIPEWARTVPEVPQKSVVPAGAQYFDSLYKLYYRKGLGDYALVWDEDKWIDSFFMNGAISKFEMLATTKKTLEEIPKKFATPEGATHKRVKFTSGGTVLFAQKANNRLNMWSPEAGWTVAEGSLIPEEWEEINKVEAPSITVKGKNITLCKGKGYYSFEKASLFIRSDESNDSIPFRADTPGPDITGWFSASRDGNGSLFRFWNGKAWFGAGSAIAGLHAERRADVEQRRLQASDQDSIKWRPVVPVWTA